MLWPVRHSVLCTVSLLLRLSVAADTASNNTRCQDPDFKTVNATGSASILGLQPPGSEAMKWTLSTAISDLRNYSSNTTETLQTFWLDTNPFQDLSSDDLPYTGCAIAIGLEELKESKGKGDSYTCNGVLSDDCFQSIFSQAQSNALQFSGQDYNPRQCEQLIPSSPPSSCKGSRWNSLFWQDQVFGNRTRLGNNNSCPSEVNVGNGTASSGSIMQLSTGSYANVANFTLYENSVKRAVPILIAGWLKNTTDGHWGDARLACMTAKNVTAGSRTVSAIGKTSVSASVLWIATLTSFLIGLD